MNITGRTVTVRWTRPGIHCWPEAPVERAYLRARHRHLFHYELEVDVRHNDREVEFHDLLDLGRTVTDAWAEDLERESCEDQAQAILEAVSRHYEHRVMRCSVWEDGEVGATLVVTP